MKFQPNGDRIFVKPVVTEAIATLPQDERRRIVQTGKVVAVGPGIPQNGIDKPLATKEGQTVAFLASSGYELELEGEKFLILFERDLLGAFEG